MQHVTFSNLLGTVCVYFHATEQKFEPAQKKKTILIIAKIMCLVITTQ